MKELAPLLEVMAAAYRAHGATEQPGVAMARRVADLLAGLDAGGARPDASPNRVAAARWMDDLIEAAAAGPAAAIAAALAPVLPAVDWVQTYSEAELGPDYLENYGYFDIASPERGLIRTNALATGFLVIGPGKLYPEHYHPAVELYHVVAGTPDWQVDDGPWLAKPAGCFIFHRSMAVHAMRTNDRPLLALYAWLGDLATSAKLGRPE
ncbi:MAG: dimethylsulfonioproprionate lyase family protein [Alphaproteobacteria bacterium]